MGGRWTRRRPAVDPAGAPLPLLELPHGSGEAAVIDATSHAAAYEGLVPGEFRVELHRSPTRPHDPEAVTVWLGSRCGGHLPTWESEQLWPVLGLLAPLGTPTTAARSAVVPGGFLVWVTLPDVEVLRSWAAGHRSGGPPQPS